MFSRAFFATENAFAALEIWFPSSSWQFRHPEKPAGTFFSVQSHEWLEQRRAEFSSTASRTGTRSGRGAVIRGGAVLDGLQHAGSPQMRHPALVIEPRSTLKLLEYMMVMTTRAPPVGGGGFLWAPDCFQVMQRAVSSDFPTGDRSPSLHKMIATLLSLCATRRLLGDAAQPSARARRAKTACEEGQPPNF